MRSERSESKDLRFADPTIETETTEPYSSIDCPATSALALAIKSVSGIDPWSPLPRVRTLTAYAPASLSPKTRMYGVFWLAKSRILAFIFSLRSSTSTRKPTAFSSASTFFAYSW